MPRQDAFYGFYAQLYGVLYRACKRGVVEAAFIRLLLCIEEITRVFEMAYKAAFHSRYS